MLTLPYRLCQGQRVGDINTIEMKNSIRLNHIFIDQPDITYTYSDGSEYKLKPKTGILGLHYNFSLTNWLYAGAGFHAASIGDQCLFLSKFQQLSEPDLTEMLKKNFRFAIIQTVVFGRHLQQKVFSKSPLTSSIRWEKREMTDKETSIGHNPLTKHFISSGSSIKNTSVITPFYTLI